MRRAYFFIIAFPCTFFGHVALAQQSFCTSVPGNTCYLTANELQQIQSTPSSFKNVFLARKTQLLADLGSEFTGLTEEGAAVAFAGIVAYELKSFRFVTDAANPAPSSRDLADLLAVPSLLCDEFVSLAIQLFHRAYPQDDSSPAKINPVGWRRDSPTSNHAQFLVTGVNVPLLVDPNLGLIAKVTLNDVLLHIPLSPARVRELTARTELSDFRMAVRDALSYGLYDPAHLIYSYVATDTNQTGGLKFSYLWSDFISSVAKGPDNRFWYTTGVGALWEVNQHGSILASTGRIVQLATGLSGTAIYCLTDSGVVYQKTPGSAWTLVSNGGISSIASGLNGKMILLLTESGDLWNVSSSGWAFAGPGIAAIVTGLNGAGTYERASGSGPVWVYTSSGWLAVSGGGIAWIAGEKNRQGIYARTAAGDLYRIDGNGVWTLLLTGISDVQIGIGGLTINVMRTDGTVWQGDLQSNGGIIDWNTGTFDWTQLWPGRTFTSIALLEGGALLHAMQVDGQHLVTSASTY